MAAPPSLAGALNDTTAEASPATALTDVGAPGAEVEEAEEVYIAMLSNDALNVTLEPLEGASLIYAVRVFSTPNELTFDTLVDDTKSRFVNVITLDVDLFVNTNDTTFLFVKSSLAATLNNVLAA